MFKNSSLGRGIMSPAPPPFLVILQINSNPLTVGECHFELAFIFAPTILSYFLFRDWFTYCYVPIY